MVYPLPLDSEACSRARYHSPPQSLRTYPRLARPLLDHQWHNHRGQDRANAWLRLGEGLDICNPARWGKGVACSHRDRGWSQSVGYNDRANGGFSPWISEHMFGRQCQDNIHQTPS